MFSLFIGIGTVAVQVLVPYAAHLATEAVRGRVVGNVMSGLLLGVMVARPLARFSPRKNIAKANTCRWFTIWRLNICYGETCPNDTDITPACAVPCWFVRRL